MGIFSVSLEVQSMDSGKFVEVEAMVDTGASYTVLGEDLLERLGIRPTERQQFQLGDDSFVEYDMGEARLRLDGSERTTPVVFGPAGVSPLLGAV
jgi:predicted aspartyl protease